MSDAQRYAIWPDPRSRSRSRAYSRIKHRKSLIKGSRPSGLIFIFLFTFLSVLAKMVYTRRKPSVSTATFCFCLNSLFFRRSLEVRPGFPECLSKNNICGLLFASFFTGRTPFHSVKGIRSKIDIRVSKF